MKRLCIVLLAASLLLSGAAFALYEYVSAASSDTALTALSVNGNSVFVSGKTVYDVILPSGTENVSIAATAQSPATVLASTVGTFAFSGTSVSYVVIVQAQDGTKANYFINVTLADAPDSSYARGKLIAYSSDIKYADGKRYDSKDSMNNWMDGAKIIENPAVPGQFIAIYHGWDLPSVSSGIINTNSYRIICIATSTDLLNWTYVSTLAGSKGNSATQATIKAVGTAFVAIWEQEPNNHLQAAYYNSWADLATGTPSKQHNFGTRQLSKRAEGTPNIYSATETTLDIGFHYFYQQSYTLNTAGLYDRNARGTLTGWTGNNVGKWTCSKVDTINNAVLATGIVSDRNIGDRDDLTFGGFDFLIMEGGGNNANFGDWRSFIYDPSNQTAYRLNVVSSGGSQAFANPTATIVTLNGRKTLVNTYFIPSENSVNGEAGTCIFYHYIEPLVTPNAVVLNESRKAMVINDTFQITASVFPSNSLNRSVTWASTGTGIASVGTNGLVTAKSPGTADIRATAANGIVGSASVNSIAFNVSQYAVSSDFVANVGRSTAPASFLTNITVSPGIVKRIVTDTGGAASGIVGTGMKLQVLDTWGQLFLDYPISVKGDLSGDGITSVNDLISVKRSLVELESFSLLQTSSADIDNSGGVDSSDIIAMKKIILGIV